MTAERDEVRATWKKSVMVRGCDDGVPIEQRAHVQAEGETFRIRKPEHRDPRHGARRVQKLHELRAATCSSADSEALTVLLFSSANIEREREPQCTLDDGARIGQRVVVVAEHAAAIEDAASAASPSRGVVQKGDRGIAHGAARRTRMCNGRACVTDEHV